MSLRNQYTLAGPGDGLLKHEELIAMYMKGASPQGGCATSQAIATLAGAFCSNEPAEFDRSIDVIEHLGLGGLGLDYSQVPRMLAYRTSAELDGSSAPRETSEAARVDSCGRSCHHLERGSDMDEMHSHMDGGGSSSPGPGGSAAEFSLHGFLDAIQARHLGISLSFQETHSLLDQLREQTRLDAMHLQKLAASNERMRDRTHRMRAEVADAFHALVLLKLQEDPSTPEQGSRAQCSTATYVSSEELLRSNSTEPIAAMHKRSSPVAYRRRLVSCVLDAEILKGQVADENPTFLHTERLQSTESNPNGVVAGSKTAHGVHPARAGCGTLAFPSTLLKFSKDRVLIILALLVGLWFALVWSTGK